MMTMFHNFEYVSRKQWAVTLLRHGDFSADEHARIAVEGIDDLGCYFAEVLHFVTNRPGESPYKTPCFAPCDPVSMSTRTVIRKRIETGRCGIRCYAKSPTWFIPAEHAKMLLDYADKTNEHPPKFNLLGKSNFANAIAGFFNIEVHNCITWAIEALKIAGIIVEPDNLINFFTDTSSTIQRVAERPSLRTLCQYARFGLVDAIKAHFSPIFDINYNTFDAELGEVETVLGYYSPLILAVAYGHLSVVKLLVEKYSANINLLSGRARDVTALDCAKQKWWFHTPHTKTQIIQYLQVNGAISSVDERSKVKEIYVASCNGNVSTLERLCEKPEYQQSANQTIDRCGVSPTEMFLGVYSPLLGAVNNRHARCVEILVNRFKVNVNMLNGRALNYTALDYAIFRKEREIVDFLKDHGAVTGKVQNLKLKHSSAFLAEVPF